MPPFFDMYPGENYNLIGNENTPEHPSNHWATLSSRIGLVDIAADYRATYYGTNPIPDGQKIAYNDISLEWGGKFDLGRRWANTGSHVEHREGINCDTRSRNIPRDRWQTLNDFFFNRGSTNTLDETGTNAPHWHLRFEFGQPRMTARYTPGNFVDMTWAETFDRQATDEEWQMWTERLEQAKAQGQPQLLAEAKTLERERFLSQEYIARNRTDEEFISDVFRSYLLREPTGKEMNDWLEVISSYSTTSPDNRALFLAEFENIQEFADLIYSLVDEHAPQLCDLGEEQECIYNGGSWDPNDCTCALNPIDYP